MTTPTSTTRCAVRAALAFSGGGSLGTWLSGAGRELLRAIRAHNSAVHELAPADDVRYLRPDWGHITIDAVAGASAGALVSAQVVRALFDPAYLGDSEAVDVDGTMTGDWVLGADFEALSVTGDTPRVEGPVHAPGWTLLSGATLYEMCLRALRGGPPAPRDVASPLDPRGVVGVGVTLTDLLGFHEPAEFDAARVLGHPEFGCEPPAPSQHGSTHAPRKWVRDLGGRGHAETRRLFVVQDEAAAENTRRFLLQTRRRGGARIARWGHSAGERLAALCTASAALPLAVGPLAIHEHAGSPHLRYRRLYMDGGVMNNKPLSPALRLARWHDQLRLLDAWNDASREFEPDGLAGAMCYERVVFFVDAFPDRTRDDWRSAHPDRLFSETGTYQVADPENETRERRIAEALRTPMAGMNVFFDAILSSLRAQDMRTIAKMNGQIAAREQMIDSLCQFPPPPAPGMRLDTMERAAAYADVCARPAGRALTHEQAMGVAAIVASSDEVSGLSGRRLVTVVPIWAPENLRAAYAGDALYSMGGLLESSARRHDAELGATVARRVLDAVRKPESVHRDHRLAPAPPDVLPRRADRLADRLMVALRALLDAMFWRAPVLRFFSKLPLVLPPIAARFRRWLNRRVPGENHVPDGQNTP